MRILADFLSELRRRRVFRVAVVYAGVAFIIFQIVDATFEPLHLPDWTGTLVVVLLALGFPIAVALAWAFDITEKGVVRTAAAEPGEVKRAPRIVIGNKTLAIVAALAVIAAAWSWLREPSPGGGPITSIAVLPLENLMGNPAEEYFVEGMHEALISALSRISALTVISRTSTMRYRDTDMLVPEIAEELGVDAIVEGSVLKAGDQVRITAQLIDGRTDKHLWTEKYDRDLRNILSLHSEVAQAIAEEIRVTLTPEEEAYLASARPIDPEAYKAYLLGRHYWTTMTGSEKGLEHFQQAVEKDSNYAPAYTGIADTYIIWGWENSRPPNDVFPVAKAAAEKALQIDPDLAEAQTSMAWISLLYDWDWPAAETGFKRATELNPSYAHAYHGLYQYHIIMGHLDESLAAIKRAQTLDPLSPEIYSHVINIYRLMGRYEEGIKEYHNAVEMNMRRGLLDWQIGLLYCRQGNYQAAIDILSKSRFPLYNSALGYAYAMSGQRAEAEEIIKELKEGRQGRPIYSYFIAYIYIGLGEIDTAFEWLERAYLEHAPDLFQIKTFPEFDFLRDDPRFQDLLQRMNFPE